MSIPTYTAIRELEVVKGISNIELDIIPICISYHIWTLVEIAKLSIRLLCTFEAIFRIENEHHQNSRLVLLSRYKLKVQCFMPHSFYLPFN